MISKDTIEFLKALKKNNNRDWFHANRDWYLASKTEFEQVVSISLIELAKIDKSYAGLEVKDCVFRINRDIRFSHDKSPYKANFGAYFTKGGKKSILAGCYMHIEPDESFIGGGLYMPDGKILKAVRTSIYENIDEFNKIIKAKAFRDNFGDEFYGESLIKAPKDFPSDFKYIDLLKHKHYVVSKEVNLKTISSPLFLSEIKTVFSTLKPFNNFINNAIEEIE